MSEAPAWLVAVLREHSIPQEGGGGTAYEAYCVCSCGERNVIRGGLRDMALNKARRHVAQAIWDAFPPESQNYDRVIPARSTDPGTSHKATEEIKIRAGSQRARLLAAFALYSVGDLTDEEAMETAVGVSPLSEYAKRCSELREAGFIEPTGETRRGVSGMERIVSRITDKGRAWIRDHT